jgi:paraquat-inducible protein B
MKKGIFILSILLFVPIAKISAQGQNLEKLNAYKIGFFTKRLDLSSAEAEKFWPVYNDYQDQKTRIQFEKNMIIRRFNQSAGTLSDSQLSEMGDKLAATIVQESALAVTFHNKLKEVLPPAKVIRFYQAENQYKVQLLNELQGRQQQRLNSGGDL